jgi:hypothetical protein
VLRTEVFQYLIDFQEQFLISIVYTVRVICKSDCKTCCYLEVDRLENCVSCRVAKRTANNRIHSVDLEINFVAEKYHFLVLLSTAAMF